MAERMRLMAVHAHPDDESSKGAATLAKYVAEGHEVLVVSCTGGERGDVLNPRLQDDPQILRELPEVRRREMAAAAEILGIDHHWLGFVDSGLPEGDPLPPLPEGCFALEPLDITVEALVREVRRFRPHVMTTYDENGGYPHPDHIMCHVVSVAAFRAAGDPEAYPHAGPAWQPLKLYYDRGFSRAKLEAFHEALISAGQESPYAEWIAGWKDRPEGRITTRVQVADYFEQRERALLAHATQVDPDGNFFRISREMQAQVWPTEDFDLTLSYVPLPDDGDEDDLFAGLGTTAEADERATRGGQQLVVDDVRERVPEEAR
ncbi:mycothiol conjugate amidase Mca [Barrientosiimonas endolithica]|uniref:Mycothiol S-conjugate amidase n=1 Tax=Barrientosiimonas endolithica TaxID=1535208 RepID=A0ABM8HDX3_9MICO|nr:mycothiol conjugate amidase Mca [Barrientosiimonas endolithica]BDZ59181.1 mycothiol S-conjugate amidase [Barrientosiimonas endolithica]